MVESTTETVNVLPAYQETYLKDLLSNASTVGGSGMYIPEYQTAGLTGGQQAGLNLGYGGVGSYLPMMQAGANTLGQGIGGYQQGMNYATSGVPLFQSGANTISGALSGASPYQQASQQGFQNVMQNAPGIAGTSAALGNQYGAQGAGYGAQGAGFGAQSIGTGAQSAQNIMNATSAAMPYQGLASNTIAGSTQGYNPQSYQSYMDPYTDSVIRQTEDDAFRRLEQQAGGITARAVGQGAFGGDREAIARQELGRNTVDQLARTTGQLRSQGYQQAQNQAQNAFQNQQARQQSAGQLFGQLGTAYGQLGQQGAQAAGQMGLAGLGQGIKGAQLGLQGSQLGAQTAGQGGRLGLQGQQLASGAASGLGGLGTSYGKLGLQGAQGLGSLGGQYTALGGQMGNLSQGLANAGRFQGQMGQDLQAAQGQDINTMMGLGAFEQQYNQAGLDANRRTMMDRQMQPYQQLAFLSDIFRGVPSSASSYGSSYTPDPSFISQLGGLATGVAGLYDSGMFGGQ